MNDMLSKVVAGYKNRPSFLVFGFVAAWILVSWLVADQLLLFRLKAQIGHEVDALNQQNTAITEAFEQNLFQLQGIPRVMAQEDAVLRALAQHGINRVPATFSDEQKKQSWTNRPQLAALNKHLAQIAASLGLGVVYVMDGDGNCIASSNAYQPDSFVGTNYAQREYFKLARTEGAGYQYAVGKVSNIPGLFFSAPIVENGRFVGVVAAKLNVSDLAHWLGRSDAFVSDQYGVVILSGDKSFEMRALSGGGIAGLSEAERLARYKRKDFLPLELMQWQTPSMSELKYFAHENVPVLVAEQRVDRYQISIHTAKHMPFATSFGRDRFWLFLLFVSCGVAIIFAIRLRIDSASKRETLEKVRRESLERLQRLTDGVPGMVYEYLMRADGSSCFPYVSKAIEDVYRMSAEDVYEDASKVFAIIHPDDLDGVSDSIRSSARELTLWRCEYRVRFEDGTVRWLSGSAMPARQADGSTLWHGFITDITERKNIDLALLENVEQLQLKDFALNAAVNAVVITDTQGRIEWANDAFSRLSGYELDEVYGRTIGELLKSGLQSKEFYEQLWHSLLNRKSWRGELLNRRKDRSLYWEEMSVAPVIGKDGETSHFVAVKQNISKRKAMERDLHIAKENMLRLLDTMAEGVFEIDVMGKIVFVNRAFLKMLGYQDASEVIAKPVHALIQHSRADGTPYPAQDSKILRVMQTRQPANSADETFWHREGAALYVEYWTHPSVMDGVTVGAITTFVDITQRLSMEREREAMAEQLRSQNRLLLEYREQIKEEEAMARDFIKQFSALDKINDPLVQFMLEPAEGFSGDMIAFARTPDDRLHVLLADSAGHGLTAALAVIPITQPFYQMTAKGFDIPSIAKEMNRRVRDYLPLPRYVACALLTLDTESQTIEVWNGGCPPVLLLSSDGKEILHQFESSNLPMGVVRPASFKPSTEHFSYEGKDCQLLLCTDGATELTIDQVERIGYDGLLSMAGQSRAASLFERLAEALKGEIENNRHRDDIAAVVVQCRAPEENVPPGNGATTLANRKPQHVRGVEAKQSSELVWGYNVALSASRLKHLDVVPFLMGITSQIDGEKADGKIFLVLSELFNNALEHGVLKLSSSLKHKGEDMSAFYDERTLRLANLERGSIKIKLEKYRGGDTCFMKIHLKDSGEGFDFTLFTDTAEMAERRMRHGRGIPLLLGTCNSLQYFGNGSEVIAHVELSEQEGW